MARFRNEIVVERGSKKRVIASTRVIVRDDKRRPEFLIAMFDDVTDRMSLSQELEDTKKFLELIVDNIPVSADRRTRQRRTIPSRPIARAETILNRRRRGCHPD